MEVHDVGAVKVLWPISAKWVDQVRRIWNSQISWERRTLFVRGGFVPYHLQCCYKLMKEVRDHLLVHIRPRYNGFYVYQVFLFEQERVFTYKSSTSLDEPETGL